MPEEVYRYLSQEDVIRYRLRLLREIQAWAGERNLLYAVEQAHSRAADVEVLHRSLGTEHPDPLTLEVCIQDEYGQAGLRLLSLFDTLIAAYRRYDDTQPPKRI